MKRIAVLVLVGLLLCLSVGAIAQDTRAVSRQTLDDVRTTSAVSSVPSQKVHLDIRTGNMQTDANDPLHTCASNDINGNVPDSAGSYSVFTSVIFPGGDLSVRTTGSNYDTILSVYTYVDPSIPVGAPLACNDDQTPGSNFQSSVTVTLPAGRYLIMVSRFGNTVAASALELNLSIDATFSGTGPINDYSSDPIALTTQQAFSQTDVHFAVDDDFDVALNADCELFNSVWYTYTAPVDGMYQFSTFGSVLQLGSGSGLEFTTALGVYEVLNNGAQISDYSLEGCYIADEFNVVSMPLGMSAGDTFYIRMGSYYNNNLLPGSKYRIKPVVTAASLLTNQSFADGLTGWTTKNFEAGDGGSNSILINAGAVKKTLSQTKTSFPSYIKWAKGGILYFGAGYNYIGTPSGKFTVRVVYSDGRPSTVVNIPFSTSAASYVGAYIPLATTKIKSVRAMATLNPGSGASVSIYTMELTYLRDPSASRASDAPVLAFPTR